MPLDAPRPAKYRNHPGVVRSKLHDPWENASYRKTPFGQKPFSISETKSMPSMLLRALTRVSFCAVIGLPLWSAAQTPFNNHGPSIDGTPVDTSVRAQDDIFLHVNGIWLKKTRIPSDHAGIGEFQRLADASEVDQRTVIESAISHPTPDSQHVADLYASFMDTAAIDRLGAAPLRPIVDRVMAVQSKSDLAALFGTMTLMGINVPISLGVNLDARHATEYVTGLSQSGLLLPDRDYYLLDDPKLKAVRLAYQHEIERMLKLAGDPNPKDEARVIMTIETGLARVSWTNVEDRDPVKTYNRVAVSDLATLAPGFDWSAYLGALGLSEKIDHVVVSEPSYLTGMADLVQKTSLADWQTYVRWHALVKISPYLPARFVAQRFEFFGTTLSGVKVNEPRWKRGTELVDREVGEELGKRYVASYFSPESKAAVKLLVDNLIAAFQRSVDSLDWMSESSKKEAHLKLDKLGVKIGYPDVWRDYSQLHIDAVDLVGNVLRSDEFELRRNLAKLGRPVDRSEWSITPQTVNAYYDPNMNEIVFPAAILQPPFFDAKTDAAWNYGAIGAIIGHEISHGFDDEGGQYDGDGNLRDWMTPDDHARFAAKTKALVAQYSAYEALPGYHVNGELTLGENIADNSGMDIAYKAYRAQLGTADAPVIDGITGDQRFFLSFSHAFRSKLTDALLLTLIKSDPHSPDRFRADGASSNQPAFYPAFDVQPGDKMYLAPEARVQIW